MLRHLLVLSLVCLSGAAYAAEGDACVPADFADQCGDASTLVVCPATGANANLETHVDCTFPDEAGANPFAPGGTCTDAPCIDDEGDGCAAFDIDVAKTCAAGAGDGCAGIAALFDGDAANDNQAGALLCADGGCVVGAGAETCDASIPACTGFGVSCTGNTLVMCLFGASEDTDNSGALNGTEDLDADGTIDSFVNPSPTAIDCATAFGVAGTCSNTATAGPLHDLIQDTTGAAIPDCDLPAEGEGEGEGDAGEGEGEDDECSQDSDCGDGETCENGSCKAPPPACSNMTTSQAVPFAALGLFTVILPIVGRRRRR